MALFRVLFRKLCKVFKEPQDNQLWKKRLLNQINQARRFCRLDTHLKRLKDLQSSTGLKGIFEGTTPMRQSSGKSQHGALRDMDPSDAGVDISGIMKVAGGAWNQIK